MELKDLLGEDYKDGMTVEEITTALAGKTFVDPTTLPKSVEKTVFDKTASELAATKRKLKELEQAAMTDDEKIQDELKKAADLQTQFQRELAKMKAKEIFVEAGLKAEDYSPILDYVVTEDEESTQTRAKSMVTLINAQKAAVEASVKAELLKDTSRPPAGGGGNTGGSFEKEIEEARANGDMATVAALIRQQAMSEKK